jgi:predicted small secreted protein
MTMRALKSLATATIVLAPLLLAACNTVAGAGKDVSGAGQDVTGAAKTVQQKL